jgi:hypothetical protein
LTLDSVVDPAKLVKSYVAVTWEDEFLAVLQL